MILIIKRLFRLLRLATRRMFRYFRRLDLDHKVFTSKGASVCQSYLHETSPVTSILEFRQQQSNTSGEKQTELNVRTLLTPGFLSLSFSIKHFFKLDECKVISSELIAMGTALQTVSSIQNSWLLSSSKDISQHSRWGKKMGKKEEEIKYQQW